MSCGLQHCHRTMDRTIAKEQFILPHVFLFSHTSVKGDGPLKSDPSFAGQCLIALKLRNKGVRH